MKNWRQLLKNRRASCVLQTFTVWAAVLVGAAQNLGEEQMSQPVLKRLLVLRVSERVAKGLTWRLISSSKNVAVVLSAMGEGDPRQLTLVP